MDGAATAAGGAFGPLWNTLTALGNLLVAAEAGTALFAFVLVILSLEFLREAKGFFVLVGRAAVMGSLIFSGACALYGDFLLKPATAAFAQLPPGTSQYPDSPWLVAGIGAAGVGLGYLAGQRSSRPAALKAQHASASRYASARAAGHSAARSDGTLLDALTSQPAVRSRLMALLRPRNRKKETCQKVKRSPDSAGWKRHSARGLIHSESRQRGTS